MRAISFQSEYLTEESAKKLREFYLELHDKDKNEAKKIERLKSLSGENGYWDKNNNYIVEP